MRCRRRLRPGRWRLFRYTKRFHYTILMVPILFGLFLISLFWSGARLRLSSECHLFFFIFIIHFYFETFWCARVCHIRTLHVTHSHQYMVSSRAWIHFRSQKRQLLGVFGRVRVYRFFFNISIWSHFAPLSKRLRVLWWAFWCAPFNGSINVWLFIKTSSSSSHLTLTPAVWRWWLRE